MLNMIIKWSVIKNKYCHSPTSTPKRSWCDHIMQWKPLPPPTPITETCKALPGNPGR